MKHLAILLALLMGGISLAMIADFVSDHDAQLINARQTSALESAYSTPAHQPVREIGRNGASEEAVPPVATEAAPIATVQEAQPSSAPATGPAKKGSGAQHKHPRK